MGSRLFWLSIGLLIGFIVGYIVRSLREIKERVEQVDEHVTHQGHNDDGLVRYPFLLDVVLLLVVALTVYASIMSQINSNRVKKTQDQQKQATACNEEFLEKTIVALNERTTYTQSAAAANVDLQKAFNFVVTASLHEPPLTDKQARKVVVDYAASLHHFLDQSVKAAVKVAQNPFPTKQELETCINKK